jgi:DNA-binding MarR family transcriptional regulator
MMPTRPGTIDLERFLPYRLSVLTNLVSGTIADAYRRRFGLSIPEWRVLAVLARHPGLSAADVAERTRMDAVAVSRAVARLVAAGRLRRGLARDDRRRSVLAVSAAGKAVYRAVAAPRRPRSSRARRARCRGQRADHPSGGARRFRCSRRGAP